MDSELFGNFGLVCWSISVTTRWNGEGLFYEPRMSPIRVTRFEVVRDNSCYSCPVSPRFVAISVIRVYDLGAVTKD
jgi:hypothetical protein